MIQRFLTRLLAWALLTFYGFMVWWISVTNGVNW